MFDHKKSNIPFGIGQRLGWWLVDYSEACLSKFGHIKADTRKCYQIMITRSTAFPAYTQLFCSADNRDAFHQNEDWCPTHAGGLNENDISDNLSIQKKTVWWKTNFYHLSEYDSLLNILRVIRKAKSKKEKMKKMSKEK